MGEELSEFAFRLLADSAPRRRHRSMRELIGIGQRWRDRQDLSDWRVGQVHRADRQVLLVGEHEHGGMVRRYVSFRDLRSLYDLIVDLEAV